MDHISVAVSDLTKAQTFFDACLTPLGGKRAINYPGGSLYVNGKNGVFFGITQKDGASHRDGAHYAFSAESTAQVDEWYDAAIKAGAKDNGKAGPRPAYGPHFYGAFVHDPVDGHHLECCYKKYNADETKKEKSKPTLYYYFGTRAMRPLWMAAELGASCDLTLHHVDLQKGEQKAESYIKLNPYGTVPTLVDGDHVLTNSVAATIYLAQHCGGGKFLPREAHAYEFATSIDRFDDIILKAFLNKVIYPEDKRDANVVSANHEAFTKTVLPHWNRLAPKSGKYAHGDDFTTTDVIWGYLLNLTAALGWITEKEHPQLYEYTNLLKGRPAFKSTFDRSNAQYPKQA